ncbi:hypothetical protein [Micromonospora sp. NPDC051141]|uniref:hypothetical protein n=1 Tax=Micromonospora sp. NPDC051141 TaxID=3364284 RepID=UPI0037A2FEF8
MTGSLVAQFLHVHQEIGCPTCTYPIWVRFSEIIARVPVICPCCRTRVFFIDQDGDLQNLGRVLESKLQQALRNAFG